VYAKASFSASLALHFSSTIPKHHIHCQTHLPKGYDKRAEFS
jgi:hypothetical protein